MPRRPPPSMMPVEQALAHARRKIEGGEMDRAVGSRLLLALAAVTEPEADYAGLLHDATFPPPPRWVYHTAPSTARASVLTYGLRASVPDDSPHWSPGSTSGQPMGVYCGATPDDRGMWSHAERWDVWEVDTEGLVVEHDLLNPGAYRIVGDVPITRLRLHGTHSWQG